MPARFALAVAAVVVLAWLGVLVRDQYVAGIGGPIVDPNGLSEAEFDESLDRMKAAQLLNPDPYYFKLARAKFFLLRGRSREAAREAEAVVRDEPQNYEGWVMLLQATETFDPTRSASAAAHIRRLNPLAGEQAVTHVQR